MFNVISKMKFDVHVHLSDEEGLECADEIKAEARNSNVVALVSNSDLEAGIRSLKLAEQYPGMVYTALGFHPWNANVLTEEGLKQTVALISKKGTK
jgi:TatD DNase family protein